MTFSYEGADLSRIIKKYKKDGCNYTVEYLDGSKNNYVCYNSDEEDRIKELMLKQLIERQNNLDLESLSNLKTAEFLAIITGSLTSSIFYNNNKYFFTLLTFIFLTVSLKGYKTNRKKIQELKKAKLFLEMANELDESNQATLLKLIEFENLYQITLTPNTLDDYSYWDIKQIYDKIKVK